MKGETFNKTRILGPIRTKTNVENHCNSISKDTAIVLENFTDYSHK